MQELMDGFKVALKPMQIIWHHFPQKVKATDFYLNEKQTLFLCSAW